MVGSSYARGRRGARQVVVSTHSRVHFTHTVADPAHTEQCDAERWKMR